MNAKPESVAARSVRVSGRVQGVFFRAWTKQQAEALGVSGWVRNCVEGSVEAHVEGEEQAVELLIERLREGPPSAVVERVEVGEAEPESSVCFEVRR